MLIIEESIIADETPSAFIRQISLKIVVDAQLSRLSSVFDSCCLCLIVAPWRKESHCRYRKGISSFCSGHEPNEIWDIIENYLQK